MISCEGIGKTIEKAIENALFVLKASREDVDIKIINEGGLFKKAKVLVTISEEALPKYQKVKEIKKETEPVIEETNNQTPASLTTKQSQNNNPKTKNKTEEKTSVSVEVKEVEEKLLSTDVVKFLEGFFEILNRDVKIDVQEDEKYLHINITGEELGDIIGHHGEGYYGLSRLVSVMNGKENKKILLDIGGYREKRAESLSELAKRTASKVAKSGRYIKLSPMTPSERRIIHTTLQEDNRVTTLSKGTEPHRYVIIFPKED